MSQKLHVGCRFQWVHALRVEDIINFDPESDIGYFVEVDCHVPEELHDLPIFPESLDFDESVASFYTQILCKNFTELALSVSRKESTSLYLKNLNINKLMKNRHNLEADFNCHYSHVNR